MGIGEALSTVEGCRYTDSAAREPVTRVDGVWKSQHACQALALSQGQSTCLVGERAEVAIPHDSPGAQPVFQLYKADTPLFSPLPASSGNAFQFHGYYSHLHDCISRISHFRSL